jgi:hypothetical protein
MPSYPIRVSIRLCIREDILECTFYPQLVPRNPNSFIIIPATILIASQWGKCQDLLQGICSQILDIKKLANVFPQRRLKLIEFTLEKQRVPKILTSFWVQKRTKLVEKNKHCSRAGFLFSNL